MIILSNTVKNLIICAIPFSAVVIFFQIVKKSLKHPHKNRYIIKSFIIALLIVFPLALLSSICSNILQSTCWEIVIEIIFLVIMNFCLSVGFMKYIGRF